MSILASLGTVRMEVFLNASLDIKSTDKCKGQCVNEEEESRNKEVRGLVNVLYN